ncbi:GNAT family N-acetyltransferase [Pseudoalteromonas phenolica]|uniref:GNAT family N-acetyltransferase n=1 Tax=Pseudoalteromonas phenolica TaxID=161398 RepID=UPI00384F07B7
MIRLANLEDLPHVLNLYRELRPQDPELEKSFSEQVWAEMMNCPETHIVVADIEGELAATCALGLNKSIANGGRPFAIIEHVITAEKFRRRGLSHKYSNLAFKKHGS